MSGTAARGGKAGRLSTAAPLFTAGGMPTKTTPTMGGVLGVGGRAGLKKGSDPAGLKCRLHVPPHRVAGTSIFQHLPRGACKRERHA